MQRCYPVDRRLRHQQPARISGAGSDCSAPDPSARGPEIGATATADETASGFLRAVVDTDRSGVSRYLAGDHLDSS